MSKRSQTGKQKSDRQQRGAGTKAPARPTEAAQPAPPRRGAQRAILLVASLALLGLVVWLGTRLLGSTGGAREAIDPFGIRQRSSLRGLAFLRATNTGSELWFVGVDGATPRRLAERVLEYDVSRDGTRLVYSVKQEGLLSTLQLYDLEAGTSRTLIDDPSLAVARPAWSPTDDTIAYERRTLNVELHQDEDEEEAHPEPALSAPKVWLIKPDGTSLGPALEGQDIIGYGARWAPSGAQLVASDTLRNEMLIVDVGKSVERIPLLGDSDWSPDGKRMVISVPKELESGEITELAIYDTATKQLTPLPAGQPIRGDTTPRWSPDGTQIAFVRRSEAEPLGNLWLLPIAPDGAPGQARRLTSDGKEIANEDPLWSPDGRVLMWSRFTVSAAGTPPATWQLDVSTRGAKPTQVLENATAARWVP